MIAERTNGGWQNGIRFYWVDTPREPCVLGADHLGPHMGYSDVGSTEPLPKSGDPS